MTEMIERVARILRDSARQPTEAGNAAPAGNLPDATPDWQSFVPAAHAVIDALRSPTDAMRAAGAEFFEEGDARQNGFAAEIVYNAMLDAASGEPS